MLTHNLTQNHHDFSAEPKVVKPRAKYREAPQQEEEVPNANANIMYDKRVIRGNTYSLMGTSSRENVQPLKNATNRPRPKHLSPNKMYEASEMEAIHADVSTPRPVEGRRHADTQTEETIEYLTDRPPEFEKDAQTDFYIDRPVNRLFVPQKHGEDRETQIWEGELFDFDYEVEPILQVLIGKTLEQGRMEVLEEEEHKQMKEEQKRYDELRYAELVEAQKMEAEERRKLDETERRRKQHRLKDDQGVTSHKKFVSRLIAKNALQNVLSNGMLALREQGNFQTAFDFELHHSLMPWIYDDIVNQQENNWTISDTINALNAIISQNVARSHEQAIQREIDRKHQVQLDLETKEREKVERRAKRAEARAERAEQERLRLLKEQILVTLIGKGEQKQNIFNQVLSDIDCLGRPGNSVGLIGGVLGELLIVLSTLEDLKNIEETDPLTNLRTINVTQETVQKLVKYLVDDLVKEGKIEVGINDEIDAELAKIDPELTLENLHTKPANAEAIRETLATYMSSYVLSAILQNHEELAIHHSYVELIVNALIDVILSADESARKVRLVKAPLDYSNDVRLESLAVFMPPIEENAPLFNLAEAKGVKTKKTKKVEGEATATIEPTATEDLGPAAITMAEIDFEDLVTICPAETPEVRALMLHRPAAFIFRRNVLIYLSSLFKELDMKEVEVLKRVNNKAEKVEKALLDQFPKKINMFVFDRY